MDNQELGSFAGQEPSSNLPVVIKMPLGVRIIAGFGFIASGIQILFGALIILLGGWLLSIISKNNILEIPLLGSGLIVAVGFLFIALGVYSWFIFRSFRKGKNWARLIIIIGSAFGLISALSSLLIFDSWVGVVLPVLINGLVLVYLFSGKVTASFNSDREKVFTKELIIAVSIIILLGAGLAGVMWMSLRNSISEIKKVAQTAAPKSTEDCSSARSEYARNFCFQNLAIKSNDFSYCEKIAGIDSDGQKANCYGNQAAATKNLNACMIAVDVRLCMSSATSNLSRYAKSSADCDLFLSPSPELITALRKQERDFALEHYGNTDNLSSVYEGGNLTSSLDSWKSSCLRSMERKNSKP